MIAGLHVVGSGRPGNTKRWYIYAWRGGKQIGVRVGGPRPKALTAAEVNAYHAAKATAEAKPTNTVAALIRDYRVSPEWIKLADNTRRQWSTRLDRIEERWGEVPLDVMSDTRMKGRVIAWRDQAANTPREADVRVRVLRSLLEWGHLRGRVSFNAAKGIPALYANAQRAKIIWSDDEVSRFAAETPQHIADVVRLAALTGLRAADLAGLVWDEVHEKVIIRTALKKSRGRRREAVVPLVPAAHALLGELRSRKRAEGVNTVLVNFFGHPWTPSGLSTTVAREVKGLGIKADDGRKKHLHDLRGTFATALFEAGFTDDDAAEVLAWLPSQVASIRHHYVDRERHIVAMAERLIPALVKPVVKPALAG